MRKGHKFIVSQVTEHIERLMRFGKEYTQSHRKLINARSLKAYMNDREKTKKQLWDELLATRQRVAELEAKESNHKQAEKALRESEEKFRAIAQTAVDAIILADSNGNIIFWNKSAQNIFGYTEDEILGKAFDNFDA